MSVITITNTNDNQRIYRLIKYIEDRCILFEEACKNVGIDYTTITEEEMEIFDDCIFLCPNCERWTSTENRVFSGDDFACKRCDGWDDDSRVPDGDPWSYRWTRCNILDEEDEEEY